MDFTDEDKGIPHEVNALLEYKDEKIDVLEMFLGRMKGYAETVNDEILVELFEELEEVYNIKIKTK